MPKWTVDLDGTLEVEADTEAEAIEAAFQLVEEDPRNYLMADATEENDDDEEESDDDDGAGD